MQATSDAAPEMQATSDTPPATQATADAPPVAAAATMPSEQEGRIAFAQPDDAANASETAPSAALSGAPSTVPAGVGKAAGSVSSPPRGREAWADITDEEDEDDESPSLGDGHQPVHSADAAADDTVNDAVTDEASPQEVAAQPNVTPPPEEVASIVDESPMVASQPAATAAQDEVLAPDASPSAPSDAVSPPDDASPPAAEPVGTWASRLLLNSANNGAQPPAPGRQRQGGLAGRAAPPRQGAAVQGERRPQAPG